MLEVKTLRHDELLYKKDILMMLLLKEKHPFLLKHIIVCELMRRKQNSTNLCEVNNIYLIRMLQ